MVGSVTTTNRTSSTSSIIKVTPSGGKGGTIDAINTSHSGSSHNSSHNNNIINNSQMSLSSSTSGPASMTGDNSGNNNNNNNNGNNNGDNYSKKSVHGNSKLPIHDGNDIYTHT